MQIEAGHVVALTFTATDSDGNVLEREETAPVAYLHGRGDFVPGLEDALTGREEGPFEIELTDSYGVAPTAEPAAVKRKELPRQWKITPGFAFGAPNSNGENVELYVHEVRGSRVYVSAEHPWGGRTVTFKGEIVQVRPATLSEREHGHAHGPGGHGH